MEEKKSFLDPLIEKAEAYGKTNLELIKLQAVEKSSEAVSTVASRSISLTILGIALGLASVGASLWLGEILGKMYYGFFFVAGFYALVGLIFYFFLHDKIKTRIGDSFVSQILNK